MKKILFTIILVFPTLLFSQIFNPVEWEFSKEDLGGGEYELFFKASIEDGWYLYSQFVEDDGPLPTTFTFFELDGYELIGTTQEGEPKQEYDPNFDMVLSYFTKEAVFSQKVKAIIVDKLGVDEAEVTPEASFTNDLGADSLDTVELIMEFEKEFDIQIPDDQAEGIATVGDAITFIEKA